MANASILLCLVFIVTTISGYPRLINQQMSNNYIFSYVLQNDSALPVEVSEEENSGQAAEVAILSSDISTTDQATAKDGCDLLPDEIKKEIKSYQDTANKIMETLLSGSFKGRTYNELGYFVDKFGSRLAGTENLENAIDYMLDKMKQDGLDNVHGEEVTIPHWVRGEEKATLLSPRKKDIKILGLGYTAGTPSEGITAPVLVVKNFDDLKKRSAEAKGKIIVYNEDYKSYGTTVEYRSVGALNARKVGAVAALVRSVTPFSIYSPHTGMMRQLVEAPAIPCACITIEDAELLHRLQKSGEKLVMNLIMNDTNLEPKTSRNSIAEIAGREKPEQVVVISGHLDSWDVGQGAMDDGGGAFISAEAVAVLRFLKLQPRRTIRAILWTSEELGLIGAQQYATRHLSEMGNFIAAFESDIGTFKPLGLDFAGSESSGCIVKEVLKLLAPINATTFRAQSDVGSDIGVFIRQGVPGLSLNNDNEKYFWYHHSEGDTMTVENADELDLCTAVWAVASYVIADLTHSLR